MEVALTPLEFARRARHLYGDREAVVDGDKRFTYAQFLERCDRWSAALQALGVGKGDRVAYIAPNTHSHLEAYYAVPQIGAILVPINYRLLAEDFERTVDELTGFTPGEGCCACGGGHRREEMVLHSWSLEVFGRPVYTD